LTWKWKGWGRMSPQGSQGFPLGPQGGPWGPRGALGGPGRGGGRRAGEGGTLIHGSPISPFGSSYSAVSPILPGALQLVRLGSSPRRPQQVGVQLLELSQEAGTQQLQLNQLVPPSPTGHLP